MGSVIEEHVAEGALAVVLRETVSHRVEVRSVCVPEPAAHQFGSQPYLRGLAGMAATDIVEHPRKRAM
jgi:hypothetical protein